MGKSLEALQNIVKFFVKKLEDEPTNLEDFETNYSQVEKSLEVLEILKEEVLLDFVNYLNRSLKGNIDETVNIMWISSQLTNYLKENDL